VSTSTISVLAVLSHSPVGCDRTPASSRADALTDAPPAFVLGGEPTVRRLAFAFVPVDGAIVVETLATATESRYGCR
jgi:hypothetical protein